MTRYREEIEAKPERDPVLCVSGDCDREATTATPEGPLCRKHADKLTEQLR